MAIFFIDAYDLIYSGLYNLVHERALSTYVLEHPCSSMNGPISSFSGATATSFPSYVLWFSLPSFERSSQLPLAQRLQCKVSLSRRLS